MAQDTGDPSTIRANIKVHNVYHINTGRVVGGTPEMKIVDTGRKNEHGMPVFAEIPSGKVLGGEPEIAIMIDYSPGGKHSHLARTTARWDEMLPDERGADPHSTIGMMAQRRYEAIKPYVDAFLKGQEVVVQGTPLSKWNGLDQRRGDIIRQMGVRTVEEFIGAPESIIMAIGSQMPDVRERLRMAKAFLAASKENAAAEVIAHRDRTIEEQGSLIETMRAEMGEMRQMMQQMLAQQMPAAPKTAATEDDGELAELRERARRAGIPRAGNKSAETLRAELAEAEQVAALADQHLSIAKTVLDGRTHSQVNNLSRAQRLDELCRMLGKPDDPAVRAHALSLLGDAP